MIISVRGTSGCGKTTLVRRVKDWWSDSWEEQTELDIEVENVKITGYTSSQLFIFGPYKEGVQTGGVDAIKWGPFRFRKHRMDFIESWLRKGYHVIHEGLMESAEVNRTATWQAICPVHAIFLDVSIQDCLAYINQRRAKRGIMEPVNPDLTVAKFKELKNVQRRLVAAGIDAPWLDREAAFHRICELLEGIKP